MDRAREIVSVGSFRDWRWDARLFEGFAVYSKFLPDATFGTGRRERLEGAQVSAELSRLPEIGPRIMLRVEWRVRAGWRHSVAQGREAARHAT